MEPSVLAQRETVYSQKSQVSSAVTDGQTRFHQTICIIFQFPSSKDRSTCYNIQHLLSKQLWSIIITMPPALFSLKKS